MLSFVDQDVWNRVGWEECRRCMGQGGLGGMTKMYGTGWAGGNDQAVWDRVGWGNDKDGNPTLEYFHTINYK